MSSSNQTEANIVWMIADMVRGCGGRNDDPTLPIMLAYCALNKSSDTCDIEINLEEIAEGNQKTLDTYTRAVEYLSQKFSPEELKEFILNFDAAEYFGRFAGEHSTPKSLCDLACAVLGIDDGDSVADLGCGFGSFLIDAAKVANPSYLFGVDLNQKAVDITKLKLSLVDADSEVELGDMLDINPDKKFDKIFANYPFGMRTQFLKMGRDALYLDVMLGETNMGRPSSADWVFNYAIFNLLPEDGRAVSLGASGAMFNGGDVKARKYFVDNNMIQAVIALPGKMFASTSIPTTMVVLGKNDGDIRMVDATDLAIPGRRWNTLDAESIETILERLASDGENSRLATKEELEQAEYRLDPQRYLGRDLELENPVKFESVIESVERGATFRAAELDKMETAEDTGFKYLKLADISDGIISSDLTNLVALDDSSKKQWLQTGDIVFSKNGAPFKVAVADVPEGETILANGNLYIVRVDKEKVNPYFIAAFFSSNVGKEALALMTVGTSIPNLPLRNLKDIQIPLLPMDVQNEIAERYQASLDEIEVLRIKTDKARIAAGEAYDMVVAR